MKHMGWVARVIAVALLLAVSGCGGGDKKAVTGGGGRGVVGDELTIAFFTPPNTLDPAKIGPAFGWYSYLAYEPLIVWDPDGKPRPGLAKSWRYVGHGNRTFELTLRPGVKFSDGAPVTADAVKASLEYQAKAGGVATAYLAGKTVKATGPLTVRVRSKTPDPQMPLVLSQVYLAGNVVSPSALKDPERLGTTTAGAGPYVLDKSATVANDHYTFVPNPDYWDKPAVHYRRVTIKVIPNPNSALNAMKTGQVDVMSGDVRTADAAERAGLQVVHTPQLFTALALLDRDGKLAPALADVRVRQALNYAIDRKTITSGLLRKYGTPTDQTVVDGQDGSLGRPMYTYDPAKAKQLLAEAGHADGLTIRATTMTAQQQSQIMQAVASDLQKVGVTLDLKVEANTNKYAADLSGGKYPAAGITYGAQPISFEGPQLFLPNAYFFNPFHSNDPEVNKLYGKAAAASDDAARGDIDRRIQERLVSQAWFVPVNFQPLIYYARPDVAGLEVTPGNPGGNPVWLYPAR
jgi:peptide/nickel transport system substrate-binding protein